MKVLNLLVLTIITYVKSVGYFFINLVQAFIRFILLLIRYLGYVGKVFQAHLNLVFKRMSSFSLPPFTVPHLTFPVVKISFNLKPHRGIWYFLLGILFSFFVLYVPYELYSWFQELPNTTLLKDSQKFGSTKILDRNGRLLYELYQDKNYEPIGLDQIPDYVIQATLAIEDSAFYQHRGVRLDSILRAIKANIKGAPLQGGSTITQQLVKNVLLSPERTLSRKIKEAVLALMVEQKYSKKEILELYFNNISYGGNAWGIQSASKKYFNKDVKNLTLPEAVLLAGLPSAPTSYNPFLDPQLAKQRYIVVLQRMKDLGYLTSDDYNTYQNWEFSYATQNHYIKAPHFVNYVLRELEHNLGKRYLEGGGLIVTTSLDLDMQDKVQKIVTDEVVKSGSVLGFTNGAALVMDSKTSEILAYVGSLDFFTTSFGAFDVITAYRQPGSSIKPLTYALALSSGYTPSTLIDDSPITFYTSGSASYSPKNYDGNYHGKVTLRQALANSYNIPAVKLAKLVGPDNIVKLGKELGLSGWEIDGSYGLSVTLGGKEVRLLDLTNAYGTFARGGVYKNSKAILGIKDGRGYDLSMRNASFEKRVLSQEVSYLIWHILSDNYARLKAFGYGNSLEVPGYKVAVKTGTTDAIKDNWTLGFTPSYVVGVWVGNNDNTPMRRNLASGLTGAAPIWNLIMRTLLQERSDEPMPIPEGIVLYTEKNCGTFSEVFIKGTNIPKTLCAVKENKDKTKKTSDKD